MINGTVSADLSPTLKLTLIGIDHREDEQQLEIDTGFNGELVLPLSKILALGWRFHHEEIATLADGSEPKMDVYRGIVLWKAEFRIIDVLPSLSKALVGLGMLEGNRLTVDVRPGGAVAITELTREQFMKDQASAKPIIGLVGGMGSGKSRVAAAFAKHGGHIVAADLFGHEALAQPDVLPRIAQRWGERVLDDKGAVDRKKLGAIVFNSPVERANLELLVFPWIEKRIREELARAQADPKMPFVVLDAAIMLEAGWNNTCDRIVYIHAPRRLRLERLQAQRGYTADEVARREAVQAPLSVKAGRADAAVDNSGSVEDTQKQVDAIVKQWGLD